MTFVVDPSDINGTSNGDVCVRTDKGTLVALIYAGANARERAFVVASALNAAFAPEGWNTFMRELSDERCRKALAAVRAAIAKAEGRTP